MSKAVETTLKQFWRFCFTCVDAKTETKLFVFYFCFSFTCVGTFKEQRECKSLEHLWKLAKQGSQQYIIENGVLTVLYERTPSWIKSDHEKLLVCPLKFVPELLHVAHDSVWGAHQGKNELTNE
jgi:hypothetical protein